MRTAVQLYTLRALDEPLTRTLDRIADTSLDGAEFGSDDVSENVREKLDETGLDVPSLGADPAVLGDFDPHLVDGETIGCDRFVLGYLGPEHFDSREAAIETAGQVSEYVENVVKHGFDLCYHNHAHEFTDLDGGQTAFDVFVDHADNRLQFELDLGWIGTGGEDPAARLEELGDRTPLVHVKDMEFETGEFADLGTGDLDLPILLQTAREQDVEWAIYEHDEPTDPLEALERDAETLVDIVDEVRTD